MRTRLSISFIVLLPVLLYACSTNNKKDYQLATSVTPAEAGTVSPENGYFNAGDSLEITATPNQHWIFDRWDGDLTGSENPAKIEVTNDLDITAMFTERTYPLNLEILGEGTVSERIIQQKSNEYPNGTLVELTANSADGWYFLEWDGDLTGTELQQEIMISGETNITAKFATNNIKTFGGSARDEAWSIDYTNDGGMILTGRSASNDGDFGGLNRGEYFSFVLKLNASGEKEWLRTFNGSDHYERASSIIQISDGGYIFTGQIFPDDSGSENIGQGEVFITKLNSNGEEVWSKIIAGNNFDFPRQVIETPNGSIMVAGQTSSNKGEFQVPDTNVEDSFLLKLDADGALQWIKTYGGTEDEYFTSVDNASDGGFIMAGYTYSNDGDFKNINNGLYDGFAMKVDHEGNIEWTTMLGGDGLDYANFVISTSDGGFLVTGSAFSTNGDFSGQMNNQYVKPYMIKLDASGQSEWLTVYEGDFSVMRGHSIVETPHNDIVVTGFSNSDTQIFDPFSDINARILALKLNSAGTVQWFKTFSGNEDEFGYSVVNFNNNSIVIAGSSNSLDGPFTGWNKGDHDIFVIRLDESGELIPFD